MTNRELMILELARLSGPYNAPMPRGTIEDILRDLPAIQRSHEAECSFVESIADPFVKRGDAAFIRVKARLAPYVLTITEQGDPRGSCVVAERIGHTGELRLGASGFSSAQMDRLDRAARQEAASAQ